jgi:hypothetical protein
MKKIEKLYDPQKGWYAGLYEKTGEPNKAIACNTNAIILEALYFKRYGRLVKIF